MNNSPQQRSSPYQGLTPYLEKDARYFFGRERECRVICANLLSNRLTLLYGPSGVGKSSLLHAGVVPRLQELRPGTVASIHGEGNAVRELAYTAVRAGTTRGANDEKSQQLLKLLEDEEYPEAPVRPPAIIVHYRTWNVNPILGLSTAIREAAIKSAPERCSRLPLDLGLRQLVETLTSSDVSKTHTTQSAESTPLELFLLLDQFEEYFLYRKKTDPLDEFPKELAWIVNHKELPVNTLLGIREDWYTRLDLFKPWVPNIYDSYLRLEHLREEPHRERAAIARQDPTQEHDLEAGATAAILWPITLYNHDHRTTIEIIDPLRFAARVLNEVRQVHEGGLVSAGSTLEVDEAAVSAASRPIETPYLQLVLVHLWEEALAGDQRLQASMLDVEYRWKHSSFGGEPPAQSAGMPQINGAGIIVRDHLERVMRDLKPDEQELLYRAFPHLVTPSGKKIAQQLRDLAQTVEASPTHLQDTLDKLRAGNILALVAAPDENTAETYQVVHDVLGVAILDWQRRYGERKRRLAHVDAERARNRSERYLILVGATLLSLALAIFAGVKAKQAVNSERDAHTRANEAIQRRNEALQATRLAEEAAENERAAAVRARNAVKLALANDRRAHQQFLIALKQRKRADQLAKAERIATQRAEQEALNAQMERANAENATASTFAKIALRLANNSDKESPWEALANSVLAVGPFVNGQAEVLPKEAEDSIGKSWRVLERRMPLRGHQDSVDATWFSSDSRLVATQDRQMNIILWNPETGGRVGEFRPEDRKAANEDLPEPAGTIGISPDLHALVGSKKKSGGPLKVYRFGSAGRFKATVELAGPSPALDARAVALLLARNTRFSTDGTRILVTYVYRSLPPGATLPGPPSGSGEPPRSPILPVLQILSAETGRELYPTFIRGGRDKSDLTGVTADPSGHFVAKRFVDGHLEVIDLTTQRLVGRRDPTTGFTLSGSFIGPNAETLLLLRTRTRTSPSPPGPRLPESYHYSIWRPRQDDETPLDEISHSRQRPSIRVVATGDAFAAFVPDQSELRVWLKQADGTFQLSPILETASDFDLSRDGSRLLTVNDQGKALLWDVLTGKRVAQLNLREQYREFDSLSYTLSPDARTLVVTDGSTARIWRFFPPPLPTGPDAVTKLFRSACGLLNQQPDFRRRPELKPYLISRP